MIDAMLTKCRKTNARAFYWKGVLLLIAWINYACATSHESYRPCLLRFPGFMVCKEILARNV